MRYLHASVAAVDKVAIEDKGVVLIGPACQLKDLEEISEAAV